jgi:hypothetical protein
MSSLSFNDTSSSGLTIINEKMGKLLTTGSITVMTWLRTIGYLSGEISLLGANLSPNALYLKISNGNYVFGTPIVSVSTPIIDGDDDNWVHICGQYDISTKKWSILRNGFVMATKTGAAFTMSDVSWSLGGRPNGINLPCQIEMRAVWIFASAISISSLQSTYMGIYDKLPSSPPSVDKLVAYWPLNEGSGQTINDLSQVDPPANVSWTGSDPSWTTDFNLGLLAFINNNDDFALTINKIPSSATQMYTIFIDTGIFPISSSNIPVVTYSSLVGAGPVNTVINGVYLQCSVNAIIRQFSLEYSGGSVNNLAGIASNGNLKMQKVDISISSNANTPSFLRALIGKPGSSTSNSMNLTDCNVSITTSNVLDYIYILTGISESIIATNCSFITTSANKTLCSAVYSYQNSTIILNKCIVSVYNGFSMDTDSNSQIIANNCKITGKQNGNVTINNSRLIQLINSDNNAIPVNATISISKKSQDIPS